MKKISFITQDLFSRGAQYATAQMAKGMIKAGYSVEIVVSQVHKKLRAEGRQVEFSVPVSVTWHYLSHCRVRQNILELRQYLRTTDADVVVSMNPDYSSALAIASFGLRKIPLMVHVEHAIPGYTIMGERRKSVGRLSLRGILSLMKWARFHRIFVVSRAAIKDFTRMNPWVVHDRVRLVYNPVVGENLDKKESSFDVSHPWLLNNEGWKTFISAGCYHKNKGQDYIIKAFSILKHRGVKARVILFGEGSEEKYYRQLVKEFNLEDHVDMPGYTDRLIPALKKSHGYIQASHAESFGISIVEALYCNNIVVATDCPFGPREILQDGKYGLLIEPSNVEALADGIEQASKMNRTAVDSWSWRRYTLDEAVRKYCEGIGINEL